MSENIKKQKEILIDPSADPAFAKQLLDNADKMVKCIVENRLELNIVPSADRNNTFEEVSGAADGYLFVVKHDKPKVRSGKDRLWISYGIPDKQGTTTVYKFPLDWDDRMRFGIDIVHNINTLIAGKDKGRYTYDENAEEFIRKPTKEEMDFYNNKNVKKPRKGKKIRDLFTDFIISFSDKGNSR